MESYFLVPEYPNVSILYPRPAQSLEQAGPCFLLIKSDTFFYTVLNTTLYIVQYTLYYIVHCNVHCTLHYTIYK